MTVPPPHKIFINGDPSQYRGYYLTLNALQSADRSRDDAAELPS